jgi:hypothetical protein
MLTTTELWINRIAQGLVSATEARSWFEMQQPEGRAETLHVLARVCHQAHPFADEVSLAIDRSGLKPSFTPCVMLRLAVRPEHAFAKIIALPAPEQIKSFALLSSLFAVADTRRRQAYCKDGCTHDWHNLTAL